MAGTNTAPVVYKAQNSLRKSCYKNTGLPVSSISLSFKATDMTDGTSTSGYIDFASSALPAGSIVLGWKAVTAAAGAWDDDTTATIQVGISGTVALYSSTTSGSVATAGTVGSVCATTGVFYQAAAATPRVTITGGSDFTAFVTAKAPASTVTIYYVLLP
jgi:hypothetical protein